MKTIVTDFLERHNVPFTIKQHSRPVFTSEEAARERGVKLSQILKTMILVGPDETIILAVVPGNKKLNLKRLKKLSGHKSLQLMDKETIEKEFGVVVGALAPVGSMIGDSPLFVDPSVFEEEVVDISSGDPTAGLELKRDDLKRLLGHATIADIAK